MEYLQKYIFRQETTESKTTSVLEKISAKDALIKYMKDQKQLPTDQIQFLVEMLSQLKLVPIDQLPNALSGIPSGSESPSGEEAMLIINYMDELKYEIKRKQMVIDKFNINPLSQKPTASANLSPNSNKENESYEYVAKGSYVPAVMPQGYTEVNGALMLYLKNVKKLQQDQIQMFVQLFVGLKAMPLDELKTQVGWLQSTEEFTKEEGRLIAQYMDNLGYEPERKRIVADRLKITLETQQVAAKPENKKSQGLTTTHIIIIVVAAVVVLIAIAMFVMMRRKRSVVTQSVMQRVVRTNRATHQ